MKEELYKFCKSLYIDAVGFTSAKPFSPDFESVIVCLFPYFDEDLGSNISLYARGLDYHRVAGEKLKQICGFLKERFPKFKGECYCDISPYSDRAIAHSAGLGFFGKNHCLINKDFGSYFFIGYIMTNIPFEPDAPLTDTCTGCKKCISACPGGALCEDGFKKEFCISYISQKKDKLTPFEEELFKKGEYIWGCDICQKVCPHNKDVLKTPILEFTKDKINFLKKEEIEALTNGEFKKKYKDRAFSYRGKNVLLRNFQLKN